MPLFFVKPSISFLHHSEGKKTPSAYEAFCDPSQPPTLFLHDFTFHPPSLCTKHTGILVFLNTPNILLPRDLCTSYSFSWTALFWNIYFKSYLLPRFLLASIQTVALTVFSSHPVKLLCSTLPPTSLVLFYLFIYLLILSVPSFPLRRMYIT